ncbi:hypothetical protein ACQKFO_21450 [Rossellomorea sp. NPDC071047]|uniref:hypothetical protein n=1 Tax=Rossellomorea sp. NPDC071047 TaxID=3390675 RepID=UPI003CFD832B
MLISLIELLTIFQLCGMLILEMYCIEKSYETFYRDQFELYCSISAMENEQEVNLIEFPSKDFAPKELEDNHSEVQVSDIKGTGVEVLFESLQAEMADEPAFYSEKFNVTEEIDFDAELNAMDQLHMEEDQDDCLSMRDLNTEYSLQIDEQYSQTATAKIKDEILGVQQWTVSVIGLEQKFIHVSDGDRTWLDVGENVRHIQNGDVLSIEVNRSRDKIEVIKIETLHQVSKDYMIPDETEFYNLIEEAV